jgi:hypothetical protein
MKWSSSFTSTSASACFSQQFRVRQCGSALLEQALARALVLRPISNCHG